MAPKPPEGRMATKSRPGLWRLFGRRRDAEADLVLLPASPVGFEPEAAKVTARTPTRRKRISTTDAALIAGGIALGVGSAFFPWYVFFNQEQFGVRAMKFGDQPSVGPIPEGAVPAGRLADRIEAEGGGVLELDLFPTGTLPDAAETPVSAPGEAEQPFPAPALEYEVVHIANGRAMIQDDQGLYIVQRGSLLPDNATVRSIEQRDGRWVLVTSDSRVMEIGQ